MVSWSKTFFPTRNYKIRRIINTIAPVCRENMLVYLSLDIICSSKLKVFLDLCPPKTVRISERQISADKYPCIFSPPYNYLFICNFNDAVHLKSIYVWLEVFLFRIPSSKKLIQPQKLSSTVSVDTGTFWKVLVFRRTSVYQTKTASGSASWVTLTIPNILMISNRKRALFAGLLRYKITAPIRRE